MTPPNLTDGGDETLPRKKKRLRARVNVNPNPNGPPIYRWASAYTRSDLEAEKYRKRREYEAELAASGIEIPPAQADPPSFEQPCSQVAADEAQTFEVYASHWYSLYKEPALRKSSRNMYLNVFKNHLFPHIGSLPLASITRDVLQEMFNRYYSANVSSSLIHKLVLTLRQIFRDAVEEDIIKKDPTRRLCPPKGTTGDPVPLSIDEVEALTKSLPYDQEDGLFPLLIIWTGLRRGEALGLRWGDIQDGMVSVQRSVEFENNRPVVGPPKTDAAYRDIPIPEPLLSMLNEHRGSDEQYVFGSQAPWTECKCRRTWQRIHKKHPILASHTIHEMRHTYNQILRYHGVDPATIQYLMGHADYETTVEDYTDITKDDTIRALRLITPSYLA